MNAARVDVLALMDRNAVQATDTRIALEWSPQWLKESAEQDAVARAAVAELIEASRHGSVILRALGGPTVAERDAAVARIAAALAACGVAS